MGPVSSVKPAAPRAAVRKREDSISTVLREQGIVTVHDQIVSLVAQRWAKAFHCKVTIHTGLEQDPWADPQQQCDIVGWQVSSAGSTMEWMADGRGIPFYLLVPRGLKESAQKLAGGASVPVAAFTSTRL